MMTTPARKYSHRRATGVHPSRSKRKALRRRGLGSFRYWKHLTRCYRFLHRRASASSSFFCSLRRAFGAAFLALWLPAMAQADTFLVTTSSDLSDPGDGVTTLREAIALANDQPGPDKITFDKELSGEPLILTHGELTISEDLEIDASALPGGFVIDADQQSRVMHFTASGGDLTLTRLALRNGSIDQWPDGDGAGLRFGSSGRLTLTHSVVSGNRNSGHRSRGGGISSAGPLTLTNSTVSGNRTGSGWNSGGGGISAGVVTLTNSTVSDNSADDSHSAGGGISGRVVTLTNSTVSGNRSSGRYGRGGGISGGEVTLTNSVVSGNRCSGSYSRGGGISAPNGAITLTACTVSGNSSRENGGGIYGDEITLTNSTLSGNRAGRGGAIYSQSGSITLNNSTVSGNRAGDYGGGIFNNSVGEGGRFRGYGSITLTDSTVSGNYAGVSGGGIGGGSPSYHRLASVTLTNSIIAGNTSGLGRLIWYNVATRSIRTEVSHCLIGTHSDAWLASADLDLNNLTGVDPRLEPLADNGGPTQTHALRFDSPAIDRGNATGTDQRGHPRTENPTLGINAEGTGSDIGAYEWHTLVVSDPGDETDGDVSEGNCTLREAIALANSDPNFSEIGFHDDLSGAVLTLQQGELVVSDSLRLDASSLLQAPIIDADQKSRVIHFTAPVGDLELDQLTLRAGKTSDPNEPGGGILFASAGDLTITRSTLSGNSTTGDDSHGGGIYAGSGALNLANSTLSGNSTSGTGSDGGGIAAGTGPVTLTSCTLSENSANGAGGGVRGGNGPLILRNSLLAGNSDGGPAPDLAAPEEPATNLEVSHSLIGNSTGAKLDEGKVNQNNLSDLDPRLGPLADHGGPTPTHALASDSPAIDQGLATGFDQRGVTRMDDPDTPDAEGGNGSDIGAFEREVILTVSDPGDVVDGDFSADNLTLREAINLANDFPGANRISFSEELSGAVIILTQRELIISDDLHIDASNLAKAPIIDADQQSCAMAYTAAEGDLELTNLCLFNGRISTNAGGPQEGRLCWGAGIEFASRGELTMRQCMVSGNASNFGGVIFSVHGTITLTHSTVSGNSGHGVFSEEGTIRLSHTTVANNTGRGVSSEAGTIRLSHTTVANNTGGGVFSEGGTIRLSHTTVANNAGTGVSSKSLITVHNSIVAGNSGGTAPDLRPVVFATNLEVSHSLIGDSTGARLDEAKVNLNNLTDLDPLLGPLADNGGPTWTMLPFPGSPVIDAGAPGGPATDQRGFARIGAPDLGAAEYQGPADLGRIFASDPEIFPSDDDGDGNPFGLEQALGTDPFLADPSNPRNLLAPTFNDARQPMLAFGIANDAAPGTLWILERTTDLRTFEEIYRFDGADHFSIDGLPIDIATTATGVVITDQAPPAGSAFYRLRTTFAAPE